MHKESTYLKFIIPSLLGLFFFLMPISTEDGTSIPIAISANWILDVLGNDITVILVTLIIVITAVFTVLLSFNIIKVKNELLNSLFNVSIMWVIIRLLAGILALMAFYYVGPELIVSADTGNLLLRDLLPTLFSVFLFAGLLLPLLLNYGFIEFIGTFFTKVMRPLFTLPGRSTVDNLASWVGDGTVGVLLTAGQYEKGFYSLREASVIATTFSVVSISFSIVVLEYIGLMNYFGLFYGTIILCGIVCALIMPRIPPLSMIKDTYYVEGVELNEEVPRSHSMFSWALTSALKKAKKAEGFQGYARESIKTVCEMLFTVLPVVMAIGTLGTVIAEGTPVFEYLGAPLVPILEFMNVPEAYRAAETVFVGFIDMFLPAVFIADVESEMTRFIVGTLSITQLIYLSEVGGVILASKIPVGIGKLFIIFLLRTIISLPIIILVAHLIF
ncbi:YjiH family protein [Aliicoccus persicus]|uniref:Nucleoside recognition GATE domain-containing membrane protein YjiH n=1 Tax=Aliicoccus persicus TaxID=930138 RepID=A0A662Z246_9STAP|nr:YjiH family protein [Aliicoccus persicus]SEV87478.1 nucleoside recognition GATE domain-containing membrane protein YjiH [Aliicoccus persicus]